MTVQDAAKREKMVFQYKNMIEVLQDLRYQKNITQQQLADAVGCGRHTISDYENYKIHPKAEILRKISAYFGYSEDYLISLIKKDARHAETVYPETKEQIGVLSDRKADTRGRVSWHYAINTLKELMTLKDDVLERIFSGIEDALANPANIKGCEFCPGRNE